MRKKKIFIRFAVEHIKTKFNEQNRRMKKSMLLLCLSIAAIMPAEARKKPKEAPKPQEKKEVRAPIQKGLFNVQHQKDDWVFQVPDSLLGRLFLTTTRYISTPVGAGIYGGEMLNSQVVYFEKAGGRLLLRALTYDATAEEGDEIAKAVKISTEDPIIASVKIDSTKNGLYSVNMTKVFNGDNAAFGMSDGAKRRNELSGFQSDRSLIDTILTFPINTEIKTWKTYGVREQNRLPAGRTVGSVTYHLNTSFVLLPETPMKGRLFDPRVGYFTDSHQYFSDDQQRTKRRAWITRWRLEPKNEEDAERQRRGELIEPKKQIVYYIDPATPKQWRKWLILGVEDWNAAFEEAGFKNAITAKEWPEDDTTMSMEDARYSVIRYLASPIANAYGPNVHDPRSGEIIESHIGWYHNVMQLVHDWYMVQASAVDPRARKMVFDDELMGQLIRFVSSHEVGHTLGLRHNKGASHATPVEKLRDKAWVEANGHTSSIMDYARFNYVAQPEDGIGWDGIFPRINDYDKWAIKWGYMPVDADTPDQERLLLNKLTVETLEGNPRLWFGGEGYDNDPRAQSEDLGDDAVLASEYGLRNLKRIIGELPEWTKEEGDLGDNLEGMYDAVVSQAKRYEGHVAAYVGGVYITYKSVEQDGPVYVPEEKAVQKAALAFLDKEYLNEPKWLEPDYLTRFTQDPTGRIKPLADAAINRLVTASMFANLEKFASYGDDPYRPDEYAKDIVNLIFKETSFSAKVSAYRRYLQNRTVAKAIKEWLDHPNGDGRPYLYGMLVDIRGKVKNAKGGDAVTRAHYVSIAQQIDEAFEHPSRSETARR